MRNCPYCGEELEHLVIIRQELATDGRSWKYEKESCPLVACPKCYSALDATDLSILGIPPELVRKVSV